MNKVYATILLVIILTAAVGGYYYFFRPLRDTRIMIGGVVLMVELAVTKSEQVKGLSNRTSLPPDHGMLFIFDHGDYWGFWMTEMKFPLDIIWFNASRVAVFIEQNLQPCTPNDCPIYVPPFIAMYVLEVNASFVSAHNISLGTSFAFV